MYYGAPGGYRGFLASPATDRNYGVQSNRKVDVYLQFKNAENNNMGMPLPAGRVRVSKQDPADQTLEFIGEDVIDHTPRNENLLLKLGSAFDVVGERRQVDFKVDTNRKTMTEEIEVKLRNQKKERVEVLVKENLYRWINWSIAHRTHEFRKEDSRSDLSGDDRAGAGGDGALHRAVQLVAGFSQPPTVLCRSRPRRSSSSRRAVRRSTNLKQARPCRCWS